MNMVLRLLATAPRSMMLPLIAALAGWYGGAKYGAPEYVMTTVDGLLAKGGAMVGDLLPGAEQPAPAQSGEEV